MANEHRNDEEAHDGDASPVAWFVIIPLIAVILGFFASGLSAIGEPSVSRWWVPVVAFEVAVYIATLFIPPTRGFRPAPSLQRVVVGMALRAVAALGAAVVTGGPQATQGENVKSSTRLRNWR